jgi:hypothetical protein
MPEEYLPRHVVRLRWLGLLLAAIIGANAWCLFAIWTAEPSPLQELASEGVATKSSPESEATSDLSYGVEAVAVSGLNEPEKLFAPGQAMEKPSAGWAAEGIRKVADWTSRAASFRARGAAAARSDFRRPGSSSPNPTEPRSVDRSLAIFNPADTGATLSFLVNGELVVLQPGEHREFNGSSSWQIDFHRGGDFGNASRVVTHGKYRFSATNSGWALTD